MGPGIHKGFGKTKQGEINYPPNSILNIDEIIENWFEYYLKGKGEKPFKDKNFLGYLMEDGESISEEKNIWVNLKEYNS